MISCYSKSPDTGKTSESLVSFLVETLLSISRHVSVLANPHLPPSLISMKILLEIKLPHPSHLLIKNIKLTKVTRGQYTAKE